MKPPTQIVISASRRTDIPAFYMPWFMANIEKGYFEIENPFNQKTATVAATPDQVHTIVFWSKNFRPFIEGGFGRQLQTKGFHLFFNFTINSASPLLEPRVPQLTDRLDQLTSLCQQFGAEAINWRFDPICFYKNSDGTVKNNLQDFSKIADHAAKLGIVRCITSFVDYYAKIKKRMASLPGFSFIDPPLDQKVNLILEMENELSARRIHLLTCCEKELIKALPDQATTRQSACIPNDLLVERFGGHLSLRKDSGQRVKAGCGCKVSIDIGSYRRQPCFHNCLFCYANPSSGHEKKSGL